MSLSADLLPPAARWVALTLCLGAAACTLDAEPEVRARLAAWVQLGPTVSFNSTRDCTAGAFKTISGQLKAPVRVASSIDEGLRLMRGGADVVAFDIRGLSPTEVSQEMMTEKLSDGLSILSAGVAARGCLDDAGQARYLAALSAPDAVLMLDPADNGLAVLDRDARMVFFSRGNVR